METSVPPVRLSRPGLAARALRSRWKSDRLIAVPFTVAARAISSRFALKR